MLVSVVDTTAVNNIFIFLVRTLNEVGVDLAFAVVVVTGGAPSLIRTKHEL